MERNRSEPAKASDGDGAARAGRPVTHRDVSKLIALVEELDRRVTRDREDIDMQFQRLAELQAVIDRLQIAATRARRKGDGHAE